MFNADVELLISIKLERRVAERESETETSNQTFNIAAAIKQAGLFM